MRGRKGGGHGIAGIHDAKGLGDGLWLETSRMMVAVASAQNPPMTIPSRARATISTAKLGLTAISDQ